MTDVKSEVEAAIVDEAKKYIDALNESDLKEKVINHINSSLGRSHIDAYIDIYEAIMSDSKRSLFADKNPLDYLLVNDKLSDFNLSNIRDKANINTRVLDLNQEFFKQPSLEIKDLFVGLDQQETTLDKVAARFVSEFDYTPTRAYLAAFPMVERVEQRQMDIIDDMVDIEAGEARQSDLIKGLGVSLNFDDMAIEDFVNHSVAEYLKKNNISASDINDVFDNESISLVGKLKPYFFKSKSSLAAKVISEAMNESKSQFHFNLEQLNLIDGFILEINETYRQKFELSGSNDGYTDYHKNKLRMRVDEASPTINNDKLFMLIKDPDINEMISNEIWSFEDRAKKIYDEWVLYSEDPDPELQERLLVYIKHFFDDWESPHPLYKYMNSKSQCAYIEELVSSNDKESLVKRGEQIFIDHSMSIAQNAEYSDNKEKMSSWIENATDDSDGPMAIQKYGFQGLKGDEEKTSVSSVYETQGLFKYYDMASILLLHSIDNYARQDDDGKIPAMELNPITAIGKNAGPEGNALTKALNNLIAERILVKYQNSDLYKIDDDIAKSGVGTIPAARYDLERQSQVNDQVPKEEASTSKKKSKEVKR